MLASDAPPPQPATPALPRAPSPAMEIEELRSMAEQFRAAPFFFEAMKEDYVSRFHGDDAKEWIDPRDVGTELEQMKTLFSKLKNTWLPLESHEKFLRRILDLDPQFPSDRDVQELATRTAEHKRKLKEKKAQTETVKKEVAELAEKVVDGHARLGVEIDAAEDMLEKIDAVEKEIGEHEAAVLEERAANEITISDAQTLVSELDTVAASIRSEIDEWKAKIASISAQNDSLFDEITKLKNQREKAFAEVDEAERLAMKKDLRLEEYGEWLKAQQPLLSSLLGVDSVTVLPPSDLDISFRPLPPLDDGTILKLRVLVNETSADRVVDIHSPGCPETFDDILDAANSHIFAASTLVRGRRLEERLPLAVRGCIRRVRNWHARSCEIRALKAAGRYDLTEIDLRRLQVTFRSGMQFTLKTDGDYPKAGIELIEVRKSDGKLDLAGLKELKGRMANERISSITQLLERLGR